MFVHSLNKVSGENKVAGAFSAKVGTFIVKLTLGDKHGDVEAAHFGVYLAAQRLLVDRHGVAWRVPVDLPDDKVGAVFCLVTPHRNPVTHTLRSVLHFASWATRASAASSASYGATRHRRIRSDLVLATITASPSIPLGLHLHPFECRSVQ